MHERGEGYDQDHGENQGESEVESGYRSEHSEISGSDGREEHSNQATTYQEADNRQQTVDHEYEQNSNWSHSRTYEVEVIF